MRTFQTMRTFRTWDGTYRDMYFKIVEESDHNADEQNPWYFVTVKIKSDAVPDPQDRALLFPPGKLVTLNTGGWYVEFPHPGAGGMPSYDTFSVSQAYGNSTHLTAEFGWDYQHYWNTWRPSIQEIETHCKIFIDWLYSHFRIQMQCHYCNKYGDGDDWVYPGFGSWQLVHSECNEKIQEFASRTASQAKDILGHEEKD